MKLETIVIGGRRYTSKEALQRFFVAVTEAKSGIVPERAPFRRKKQIEQAEKELEAAGI